MDVYAHEKEQIENIKAWWRENRWFILGGLLISAAVVFGWRYWQAHQLQQAEAASIRYEAVLLSARVGDAEAVQTRVVELQNEFSATPYAALGSLRHAAMLVEAGDYEAAAKSLRWAMEKSSDKELAKVARLRLARVELQRGETDAALAVLADANGGKFQPLFDEVRGDVLLVKGDRDGARAAYENALATLDPQMGDRELVQKKLRNVALPTDVIAVGQSSGNSSVDGEGQE